MKKKFFIMSGITVGIIVISVSIFLFIANSKTVNQYEEDSEQPLLEKLTNTSSSSLSRAPSSVPSCEEEKNDYYTNYPLKQEDVQSQIALGNLNPPSHTFPTDHIYLHVTGSGEGIPGGSKAISKPLYSMGDMWVTGVSSSENITTGVSDYGITYFSCKELMGQYGHVGSLVEKITDEMGDKESCNEYETGGETYRSCRFEMLVKFGSGEVMGTAGDGQSGALDIWATDYRQGKLLFANPDNWRTDSFYNACPADYFTEELKKPFMARFGGYDGSMRTKEPVCGTIEVDVAGTAQGYWFAPGSGKNSSEDDQLALSPDNIETNKQAFSMGSSGESKGFKSDTYYFIPKNDGFIDRDFSQVKPDGNIYCYDTDTAPNSNFSGGQKSAIYFSMPDDKTVRIEDSGRSACGTGPWTMVNYIKFVR